MKIALVHDHLTQDGGAEKVLIALQEAFEQSPIFTLVYNKKKANNFFLDTKINTSFIQKIPFGVKKFEWFLVLMPAATENYDLSDYDVIISSVSSFAKGIITKPGTIHISYCHTPTRYLWSDSINYVNELKQSLIIKKSLPLVLTKLRQWDRLASDRVDFYIANSQEVKKRIKKYYHKDSIVIHPPVETDRFKIRSNPEDYFLTGGRLVPYKRFDLTIHAFNRLGIKLKIFGDGPQLHELKKSARHNIEFLGKIDDNKKIELFEKCQAFINPQVEDFGITAVEAMCAGRPVIAYNKGGAQETVIEGVTGTFFHEQEWETLADKIIRFDPNKYNPIKIREHALQFDKEIFKQKIIDFVTEKTNHN